MILHKIKKVGYILLIIIKKLYIILLLNIVLVGHQINKIILIAMDNKKVNVCNHHQHG